MNIVIAAAASGVAVGAVVSWLATYRWHLLEVEDLGYADVRVKATRVRELYNEADHERRRARRLEAMYHQVRTEAREWIGDLLDTVAARDRVISQLSRPRHQRNGVYSPERWSYGGSA